jgi:hypothetical protein
MADNATPKELVARALRGIDKLWESFGPDDFNLAYDWIAAQAEYWDEINEARDTMDKLINEKADGHIIQQAIVIWYRAWEKAIGYANRYILTRESAPVPPEEGLI